VNIEEARLYLEHTSKEDFNLEEHQKENRYQAIQVVLKEIERLNNDYLEMKDNFRVANDEIERLNNIIKVKTDFIEELLKIIAVARDYELHDKCYTRAKMYEDKLKELKGEYK